MRTLALGLVSILVIGCGDTAAPEPPAPASTIRLALTNPSGAAVVGASQVEITIQSVEAHAVETGWSVLSDSEQVVELTGLSDLAEIIADAELAPGTYTQLRLVLSDARIRVDGEWVELECPSCFAKPSKGNAPAQSNAGGRKGLKVPAVFVLLPSQDFSLALHFDVAGSVVATGNGRWKLKPRLFVDPQTWNTADPGDGVAGADVDEDGIRDDVAAWMANAFANDIELLATVRDYGTALQATLNDHMQPAASIQHAIDAARAVECLLAMDPANDAHWRSVRRQTLDTQDRLEAWIYSLGHLRGHVLDATDPTELAAMCGPGGTRAEAGDRALPGRPAPHRDRVLQRHVQRCG